MKMKRITAEASEGCSICGTAEGPHRQGEASGQVNHQYSTDGQLRPVEHKAEPKPDRVVASADPVVRLLLIEKGIFTYDELTAAEVKLYGRERVPERP